MYEKDLENLICAQLHAGAEDPSQLEALSFSRSTSAARNVRELIDGKTFALLQDTSEWDLHRSVLHDLCGGMTPDIVVRSKHSGQNRIYIEVKLIRELGYGKPDSQVVRYLLHLLATSEKKPSAAPDDIRRAVILAAPPGWFVVSKNAETWNYFLTTYGPLAAAFDVTLAEIQLAGPQYAV